MLPEFRVRDSWKKLELLQKLAWQDLGLWVTKVWWKLESRRKCSLYRKRKMVLPDLTSPALQPHSGAVHHWTYLESNWQGGCTLQNAKRLGNECAQTEYFGPVCLLDTVAFLACSALHPISVFLFMLLDLSVYIPQDRIPGAREQIMLCFCLRPECPLTPPVSQFRKHSSTRTILAPQTN